jgi:tRNA(fMet)-specific endonuclease VapC
MTYLLDTNVLRQLMDQHPQVLARMASVATSNRVAACAVVRGEALFGVERIPPGKRRDAVEQNVRAVLASLHEEAVPVAASEHYASIKRGRERAGMRMEENDLWIAATALALGAVLVTHDVDFQNTAGLITEDWTV